MSAAIGRSQTVQHILLECRKFTPFEEGDMERCVAKGRPLGWLLIGGKMLTHFFYAKKTAYFMRKNTGLLKQFQGLALAEP